jgi:antitoxin MazE
MRTSVRCMGNSAGIILPKPILAELGVKVGDDLSLTLEKGRVVLTPAKSHPRQG